MMRCKVFLLLFSWEIKQVPIFFYFFLFFPSFQPCIYQQQQLPIAIYTNWAVSVHFFFFFFLLCSMTCSSSSRRKRPSQNMTKWFPAKAESFEKKRQRERKINIFVFFLLLLFLPVSPFTARNFCSHFYLMVFASMSMSNYSSSKWWISNLHLRWTATFFFFFFVLEGIDLTPCCCEEAEEGALLLSLASLSGFSVCVDVMRVIDKLTWGA